MDTTALRTAYDGLLDAAATPDLGEADDGGWNVDQILAHVLSVDASIAAAALEVVAGARPSFDNRLSHDPYNLDRIIAEHEDRKTLMARVRAQASVLCDIADRLTTDDVSVLVPTVLVSHDTLVLDQPIPLATLIDGLANDHVPVHTQQVRDLRVVIPSGQG